MLHHLFGVPTSDKWSPIGGRKEIIKEAIDNDIPGWESKGIKVVRMKHSSGNNPAPDGLYLAQDNGPSDIVSNPRFLLTPASVLDPAGKTKRGPNIVNVITKYNTLPHTYIDDIGMDNVIKSDISMSERGNNYRVTIPVRLEGKDSVIVEDFSKESFAPQELNRVRPSYFAGNREKNAQIRDLIGPPRNPNVLIEGEKYILCKELGDTLQVQWLNHIFNEDSNITRANTVIGTTDEVVLWRSIVNKVGVIYTNSLGQTKRYLPVIFDPEEIRKINVQRIESIRYDLITHNISVIMLIYDIIMKGHKIILERRRETTSWIENITWNLKQLYNAVNFLNSTCQFLINRVTNLYNEFTGDSEDDIQRANELANAMRFTSPFVKYRTTDTYKIIMSTTHIFSGYPFPAKTFFPSNFNDPRPLQTGGSLDKILAKVGLRLQDENQNIDRIESILTKNDNRDPIFLFCFVREFFPELFTYAYFMKASFVNVPFYDNKIDFYQFKQIIQKYSWVDDRFIEVKQETFRKAIIFEILKYAILFINLFPDFKTQQLEFFFTQLNIQIKTIRKVDDNEINSAATIAIALYEPYYLEELRTSSEMDSRLLFSHVSTTLLSISEYEVAREIYDKKYRPTTPAFGSPGRPVTAKSGMALQGFIKARPLTANSSRNTTRKGNGSSSTSSKSSNNSIGPSTLPPKPPKVVRSSQNDKFLLSPRAASAVPVVTPSRPLGTKSRTPSRVGAPGPKQLIVNTKPPLYPSRLSTSSNNSSNSKTPKKQTIKRGWISPTTLSPSSRKPPTKKAATNSNIITSGIGRALTFAGGRRTRRKNKTRR